MDVFPQNMVKVTDMRSSRGFGSCSPAGAVLQDTASVLSNLSAWVRQGTWEQLGVVSATYTISLPLVNQA